MVPPDDDRRDGETGQVADPAGLQFLGVFQNAPELRLKEFRLFLSEIESCESRDVRHVDVDRLGHGNRLKVEMAHEPDDGDTKRNHENQKDDPSFAPLFSQ